ncbi:hypothetical protein K7B06_25820 [Streptomyces erythrochromogenes]|nr:hypothetical protein [Streptomyces erythrochromogenes]
MLKSGRAGRTVVAPVLGALLIGLSSLAAGSTASASESGVTARPTNCRYEVTGKWGAAASCGSHNGGSYRSYVLCEEGDGSVLDSFGPWRQWGDSIAYCMGSSKAKSAGIQTSVRNNG